MPTVNKSCSMVDDNVASVYNRCPFVMGGYAVNVVMTIIILVTGGCLITSHWLN